MGLVYEKNLDFSGIGSGGNWLLDADDQRGERDRYCCHIRR